MIFVISLIIAILFSIIFQKKLIKHPGVFYVIFLVIGIVVCVLKYSGINVTGFWGTYAYPILDKSALGTAFFVLVMYTGAFKNRTAARKLFMPIRRQLSIIACLLTFGHNIAYGKTYFVNLFVRPQMMPTTQLLAAICSVIMILILIPLFITSFIGIRKKMNPKNWKKLQRLAYIVYALIYVHVMLLNMGAALNGTARNLVNAAVYTGVFLAYLLMRLGKAADDKGQDSKTYKYMYNIIPAIAGVFVCAAMAFILGRNIKPEAIIPAVAEAAEAVSDVTTEAETDKAEKTAETETDKTEETTEEETEEDDKTSGADRDKAEETAEAKTDKAEEIEGAETDKAVETAEDAAENNTEAHDNGEAGSKLKDGTYTATEFGYTGDITLAVVIENGEVTDVYFEEYYDDEEYKAYGDYQLGVIKKNPMAEVDAISGATFSTTAIKKAYENALAEAVQN